MTSENTCENEMHYDYTFNLKWTSNMETIAGRACGSAVHVTSAKINHKRKRLQTSQPTLPTGLNIHIHVKEGRGQRREEEESSGQHPVLPLRHFYWREKLWEHNYLHSSLPDTIQWASQLVLLTRIHCGIKHKRNIFANFWKEKGFKSSICSCCWRL